MKDLTGDLILQKLSESRNKIHEYGISRVGLFGSFVRGDQHKESDVDLLVEFQEGRKTYRNFMDFSDYIEKTLGRRVEILTPEALSPYIYPYVKKEIRYVQI